LPRWDLHLACGISVSALCLFSASLPFIGSGTGPIMSYVRVVALPISIGTFSLLIGSILPDIDGKGRIRWVIGPVIGAFALIMMAIRSYMLGGPEHALAYIADDGALLFLLTTVLGYGILIIPMKHRGAMHRMTSALAFSLVCMVFFMLALSRDGEAVALVGAMAFSGYGWHLALDGSI